ncbi:carbohydrate sulfotransferase 3-like [Saccoglossus kowalevskii]|uniref:Carbohydrate sulfotransferase 3-like n=1 Tax=Saccoglossus kowalevskii TaxID=10224 RepID=A0ABM0MD30_SACKO|nr:PREDICTED: carbohydrate sulfotransferase 3-like [Saccoglossus kowalevskii]
MKSVAAQNGVVFSMIVVVIIGIFIFLSSGTYSCLLHKQFTINGIGVTNGESVNLQRTLNYSTHINHVEIETSNVSTSSDDKQNGSRPLHLPNTAEKHVRILVTARMQTGSKAIAEYFGSRSDFFYAYEPGHMIMWYVFNTGVKNDRGFHLGKIQTKLRDFLHDIFHCSFANHPYFTQAMNEHVFHKIRGHLDYLPSPITEKTLTSICLSKQHIISKVVRLTNLLPFIPRLQNDNVKVLFLARDPRGMVSSRYRMIYPGNAASGNTSNIVRLQPKLKLYVEAHCKWLEDNYNAITTGPVWLRENSMLVRFEDMAMHPDIVVPIMYKFVGLKDKKPADGYTEYSNSVFKWRDRFTFREVEIIQNVCSDRVYNIFGWEKVRNQREFEDKSRTFVLPMPKILT